MKQKHKHILQFIFSLFLFDIINWIFLSLSVGQTKKKKKSNLVFLEVEMSAVTYCAATFKFSQGKGYVDM